MPEDQWAFDIKRIDLDGLSVDAARPLGMVVAQPYFEVLVDHTVPMRIAAQYRDSQVAALKKAFEIQKAEATDPGMPVPFVLFPELAIPTRAPDGLQVLSDLLADVEEDTVFIGGLEGIAWEELPQVVERFPPVNGDASPCYADGNFVNLCVIATSNAAAEVKWHYQAKIAPSQWEQPRNMAEGRRILHFLGPDVGFICQICFDAIAAHGPDSLGHYLCERLSGLDPPHATQLDYVFVPQYNRDPQAEVFERNARAMLTYERRGLRNSGLTLISVNRAASNQEVGQYADSGIRCRSGRWQVSSKTLAPIGYSLTESRDVTSAIFRKRTEAIHVAQLIPPEYNTGDPSNLRGPMSNPKSYLLPRDCADPTCSSRRQRRSGAGEFVECRALPCKLRDSLRRDLAEDDAVRHWQTPNNELRQRLASHYEEIRTSLFALTSERAGKVFDLLFLQRPAKKGNPDLWTDQDQGDAVVRLAAVLSVFREKSAVLLKTRKQWTAELDDLRLVVVDSNGEHWQALAKEYWKAYGFSYCGRGTTERPVLLMTIRSEGDLSPAVQPYVADITRPRDRGVFHDQDSLITPPQVKVFVSKEDLGQEIRRSPDPGDYMRQAMRCIFE